MKILTLFILPILALFHFGHARAEYGCQSGFVPVYQGNRQVCVADYNLPVWKQQGDQKVQHQPAEIWEDRYGAIVKTESKGYLISVDAKSKRQAEKEAMSKCGPRCKLVGTFRNTCTGMTWGGGETLFRGGSTKQEAERASLDACENKTGGACEVIHSACSLPVRVQ